MARRILIFFTVLLVVPLIIGNEDIKCREVSEAYNICMKDNALVYVNQTNEAKALYLPYQTEEEYELRINESELTSIAPNAFRNLSNKVLVLSLHGNSVLFKRESFEGLEQVERLHISSAILALDENIFEAMQSLNFLILDSCKIVGLKRGAFAGLSNLGVLAIRNSNISGINIDALNVSGNNIFSLELQNNSISTLKPNSFESFENLRLLSLSSNQLTDIEPGTFNGLNKLSNLHLEYNQFTIIRKNVFNHVKSLDWVWFDGNKINAIETEAFDGLSLTSLSLHCNRLKVISSGFFEGAWIDELQLGCNHNLRIEDSAFSDATIKKVFHHEPSLLGDKKKWGPGNSTVQLLGNYCLSCPNNIPTLSE